MNNYIINPYKLWSIKGIGNLIETISPQTYEILLNLHTSIKDIRYKTALTKNVLTYSLFEEIDIETINRCNGLCSFCPVNKNIDTRPYHLMNETLFKSIIEQLHNLDYNKIVCLFCNNEPLLDNRIYEFAEYTRSRLPFAKIIINTNGSVLTPEKFNRLILNLDLLIVDNYNDKLELNPSIKTLVKTCLFKDKYIDKVQIILRKQNEILTSRSGQAKNRKTVKTLSSPCVYPYMQLSIRSNGEVSMCCNDALGEETLGDTNKESLKDIWYGNKFKEIRQKMLINRNLNSICKKCDSIVIPTNIR